MSKKEKSSLINFIEGQIQVVEDIRKLVVLFLARIQINLPAVLVLDESLAFAIPV